MPDFPATHPLAMASNRIRELRKKARLTQDQLGQLVGLSGAQISRLETETQDLTLSSMRAIAEALQVAPEELIAMAAMLPERSDVEPADLTNLPGVSLAIAQGGMQVWKVAGTSVISAGVEPGQTIVTRDLLDGQVPRVGDIVLCAAGKPEVRVLRQFLPPGLVVTNRPGANLALRLDDPDTPVRLLSVVVRGASP